MRKSLAPLSELVMRCLDYCPENRPDASTIYDIAVKQIDIISSTNKQRTAKSSSTEGFGTVHAIEGFWKDDMVE